MQDHSEADEVNINFKPKEKKKSAPKHYTIETLNNYLKNPFKEDKNKDKDSKIDNREESIKERHINKEKDNLHNSILIENENDLKESQIEAQENEIKVKEIEHDEINVEINEKGEEKTCVESEESNILDLIDENNDNLLNQEEIVYWTPNGKTYHSKSTCRTLARSKIINSGTVNESGKDFKCENCK